MTPLLTVFVPAHNGASFIREAIESIISSTVNDLEIVVIDDGSTDGTPERVEQIRHPAIRLYRNPTNLGIAATRHRGVALARGQYLALHDHDDVALPGRFERQLERLESAGGPDILGGCMELFGERQGIVRPPPSHLLIRTYLLFFSPIANPTACMRLQPFRDGRLEYSIDADGAEDYDLWFQGARAGLRMENLDSVVTRYRCHREMATSVKSERMARQSHGIRCKVGALYFPELTAAQVEALAAAAGGRGWQDAREAEAGIGALAHAASLASEVADIDAGVMTHQLQESLLAHVSEALRHGIVDNDFLEDLTERDDRFERWRANGGGALDRRLMDLVMSGH